MNGAQQQIYKMLAEVLGGHQCVKPSALSPYYHTVGESPADVWSFPTKLTLLESSDQLEL
jgi:hypothetical protein